MSRERRYCVKCGEIVDFEFHLTALCVAENVFLHYKCLDQINTLYLPLKKFINDREIEEQQDIIYFEGTDTYEKMEHLANGNRLVKLPTPLPPNLNTNEVPYIFDYAPGFLVEHYAKVEYHHVTYAWKKMS